MQRKNKSIANTGGSVESREGFDHGFGHARVFFPARQELAIAQTACRASKNTLA
jgi:hypothetical protein